MNQQCPCGACVTCACAIAPECDEDGCCLGCGGVPVEIALRCGVPHVGIEVEDSADRHAISVLIAARQSLRAQLRAARIAVLWSIYQGLAWLTNHAQKLAMRALDGSKGS